MMKAMKKTTIWFFSLGIACPAMFGHTTDAMAASKLSDKQEEQATASATSPTEGVITHTFVEEKAMQQDLLQMLARSLQYAQGIWQECDSNSRGEACGYFRGYSAGQSNEDGVRTNADFAMICAFLYKYAKGKTELPQGITWEHVRDMATKALTFGYSTHKANRLKTTTDGKYWGSTGKNDNVWESSLWTASLAYAAYFLDHELDDNRKRCIYQMIKAECNYELERDIPTGYAGDTKAEENGWETNILACALGLYPDDPLAAEWFGRLRQFAINCYSQADDAQDSTVIDPDYDNTTVRDLYIGKNLYDDYTLQNHNYFHTSYQNVVMQELGESALALKLFQGDRQKWKTNALMHNNRKVLHEVLYQLALADGELAMPNGNDWSMFLYDQITSYTTAACFLRDPAALMLENLAYKNIKARQSTTTDGSWLLNSDIGPRRMGVQGHRVMMTYLMHELASTTDLQPMDWDTFSKAHETARLFTSQNIVRANTAERFSVFSWSEGLRSYTGYIAANVPDRNKIIVPYKANNTGNIIGWYTVEGKKTDAVPVCNGIYDLKGNSYTMNGQLFTNEGSLENHFTLYSTPGNAFIYMDYVTGKTEGTITGERGGLTAISTDPFTKEERTLYYTQGHLETDGRQTSCLKGNWVNIDNAVGIVTTQQDNTVAFGDRELNSSIHLAKLYPSYSDARRPFVPGSMIDRRQIIYYSNVSAATTAQLAERAQSLAEKVPEGWNGLIAYDPDGTGYLLLSNYCGAEVCTLENLMTDEGAPVFMETTTVTPEGSSATFRCTPRHSISTPLRIFVRNGNLRARLAENDSCCIYLYNNSRKKQKAQVILLHEGKKWNIPVSLRPGKSIATGIRNGNIFQDTIQH